VLISEAALPQLVERASAPLVRGRADQEAAA